MKDVLNYVYYDLDSPACFSSITNVLHEARKRDKNIKRSDVVQFLAEQETYTLHKPIKRKFLRNKTRASCINSDFQADLADMQKLKQFNDNYGYILTVIDVLSRFSWAVPIKTKSPVYVKAAFEKIFTSSGREPYRLYTDRGLEFYGEPFASFLKQHGIEHYSPKNQEIKCAVIERYNRTLKTRLWRLFTAQRSYRWIDKLQEIVDAINNTPHRTIGIAPALVNKSNEEEIYQRLYGDRLSRTFRFAVGEQVRISKYKHLFEKGYVQNFTTEIFTIAKRISRGVPVYALKDYYGDLLDGYFYEHELVKVIKTDDVYRIEKVLKQRTVNGKKQLFVKWDGYPDIFNQWIDSTALTT